MECVNKGKPCFLLLEVLEVLSLPSEYRERSQRNLALKLSK